MSELLRIFPGSAGLKENNETLDGKPAPLFLDRNNCAPYGWMKDYSKMVESFRKHSLNENFYAHKPWQTYLAVTNLVEHLLQNKERIAMFIDDIASEILLLASEEIGSYTPKEMDIILNGPPTQEQFGKWMQLQENEGISVKMLQEYHVELPTLMFGGSSYMRGLPHERFMGEVSPIKPECTSKFNFEDEEEMDVIVAYWSSKIKSKAVELSPAEMTYSK